MAGSAPHAETPTEHSITAVLHMTGTKRDAIEQAALKLFAEKGIQGTTTRSIARLARTAEGNIYRHFKSKEDLSEQIFDRCARQFNETLLRSSKDATDPVSRLTSLVVGIFTFADTHPDSFAYLMSAPQTSLIESRHLERPPLPMQCFVQALEEGIAEGVWRPINAVLATGWIVSMSQRAVVFSRAKLVNMDRAEVVRETVEAVIRILYSAAE